MSLKEVMWGEGEGESSPDARRRDRAMGLGSDLAKEEPRLPGDMNLEMSSADPSFSHLCPSSCTHTLWLQYTNNLADAWFGTTILQRLS